MVLHHGLAQPKTHTHAVRAGGLEQSKHIVLSGNIDAAPVILYLQFNPTIDQLAVQHDARLQ